MNLGSSVKRFGGMNIGNWFVDSLGMSHLTTSASFTEYWQGMMSDLKFFLILLCTRIYWCPHHYDFRNYRGDVWWYEHWQWVCGQFGYVTIQYKCFHH